MAAGLASDQNRPAYRVLFSGSTMALSCLIVAPVLRVFGLAGTLAAGLPGWHTLPAVVAAGLAFTTVNAVLIAIGVKLHGPRRDLATLFGTWADNALELATLCLGGITAALLVAEPELVPLMLLPVVVLHRCVLMRQLEEMARQDSKTGLLTDVEWKNRAISELARAERTRAAFAVLFIDLDNFKRINDTYGHLAGDQVLRTVADTVRAEVRAYDSVGRWGGEEYAVLLPEIPDADALAVAERIRHAIAHLTITAVIDDHPIKITDLSASIGVATYPAAGTALERIIHRADRAMYRAKKNGRNQVVSIADA